MKTFQLLFSFFALKKISQVHQVHRNYPSSITFSQLWWNSSQLARLFKVKVALSPDLNTACWFARMDLSASVQKQGCLSASAVKHELDALKVDNTGFFIFFKVAFIGFCKWTLHMFSWDSSRIKWQSCLDMNMYDMPASLSDVHHVFLLNRTQFKGKHSEVYWASGGQTSQVMDISHLSFTQTAPRLVPWVIFPYYLSSSHCLALFWFCLSGCCSVLNHSGLLWLHQSLSDELVFICPNWHLKMNQMRWINGDVDCHFNKLSR